MNIVHRIARFLEPSATAAVLAPPGPLPGTFTRKSPLLLGLLAVLALVAPTLAQTLTLTAKLPNGALYSAQLDQTKRWATLVSGPGSPRILGAHAFFEMANPDAGAVAIFVSNAACDAKSKQHPGLTFFRSIAMTIDGKWTCEREYGPNGMMLVPQPAVGDHMMPSGRGLVFRFAIYRGMENRRAAVQSLNRVSDYQLADIQAWGPAQTKLPTIPFDFEPGEAATLKRLYAALAGGKRDDGVDLRRPAIGKTWHEPGSELAYEYGGFEINTVWGWQRSRSSFLRHRLISDRWAERVLWCFDINTGEPMDSEAFAKGAGLPYQPFEMYADGNVTAVNTEGRHTNLPPAFDVPPFNAGNCLYRGALEAVEGVDIAHDVRCQGHAWAAYSLGRDTFTGFFIRAHSNYVRLAWSDKGRPRNQWESDGNDYRSSLSSLIERAQKNPGRGSADRRFAWTLANACAMHWVAPNEAEKAKAVGWLRALLQYHATIALPTGLVGNFGPGGIAGAWDPISSDGAGIPKTKNATQCFHEALVEYWALAAMKRLGQLEPAVLAGPRAATNSNLRVVKKAADSMWFNPKLTWKGAPPHYVVTAVNGVVLAEIVDPGYGAPSAPFDAAHVEPCLARLRELLGDQKYEARLLQVGGNSTEAAKRAYYLNVLTGKVPYADPAWAVEPYAVFQGAAQ